MRCPYCNYRDSRVTDLRTADDGIRRRRSCIACGERFTTFESVQLATVMVVKKDGRREPFNREKLLGGLRVACSKREISVAQLDCIVADIEASVGDGRAEVASHRIGELAMDALRALDHIAYIRFASVYRSFADFETLKEAVLALEAPEPAPASVQLTLPAEAERPRPLILTDIASLHVSQVAGR